MDYAGLPVRSPPLFTPPAVPPANALLLVPGNEPADGRRLDRERCGLFLRRFSRGRQGRGLKGALIVIIQQHRDQRLLLLRLGETPAQRDKAPHPFLLKTVA